MVVVGIDKLGLELKVYKGFLKKLDYKIII